MRITATPEAEAVVERAKGARPGALTISLGTGCCESTAPFLYEDFWPGPDHEVVGEASGVAVYAPEYLRSLYPGDEAMVIDVFEGPAESMSIETEWGVRLILRGHGVDTGVEQDACEVPFPDRPVERRGVVGTLPPHLAKFRIR